MVMTMQVRHKITFAIAALLMLAAALDSAHAAGRNEGWREQISAHDSDRLANLEDSRQHAVAEAEHGNGSGDVRAIRETLSPPGHEVPARALYGNWRCRQIKLGGMTDYAVFSWFPCRITKANGGIRFEKLGTQRMAGMLYPENGMWVYLGAQSARGEPLHAYSGGGASVGGAANIDDQVGVLVGIGNNRLRIDLPAPAVESDFDSIELVR
jgi:hypothetical protein